jgi:hypothetical protein
VVHEPVWVDDDFTEFLSLIFGHDSPALGECL